MKVKIDDLDLNIFNHFLEANNSSHTVVDIAKGIYDPRDRNELIKLISRITYRLKKLCEHGLFNVEKNNEVKTYSINFDNVFYDDSSINIGSEVLDMGKALVLTVEGGYLIYFLDRIE